MTLVTVNYMFRISCSALYSSFRLRAVEVVIWISVLYIAFSFNLHCPQHRRYTLTTGKLYELPFFAQIISMPFNTYYFCRSSNANDALIKESPIPITPIMPSLYIVSMTRRMSDVFLIFICRRLTRLSVPASFIGSLGDLQLCNLDPCFSLPCQPTMHRLSPYLSLFTSKISLDISPHK